VQFVAQFQNHSFGSFLADSLDCTQGGEVAIEDCGNEDCRADMGEQPEGGGGADTTHLNQMPEYPALFAVGKSIQGQRGI